jgi:hypothetical protein
VAGSGTALDPHRHHSTFRCLLVDCHAVVPDENARVRGRCVVDIESQIYNQPRVCETGRLVPSGNLQAQQHCLDRAAPAQAIASVDWMRSFLDVLVYSYFATLLQTPTRPHCSHAASGSGQRHRPDLYSCCNSKWLSLDWLSIGRLGWFSGVSCVTVTPFQL